MFLLFLICTCAFFLNMADLHLEDLAQKFYFGVFQNLNGESGADQKKFNLKRGIFVTL